MRSWYFDDITVPACHSKFTVCGCIVRLSDVRLIALLNRPRHDHHERRKRYSEQGVQSQRYCKHENLTGLVS